MNEKNQNLDGINVNIQSVDTDNKKNNVSNPDKLLKNKWIICMNIILYIGLVALDQYVKMIVREILPNNTKELIPNVLEFHYLENRGAAFGMLQGQRIIFMIITVLVYIGIGYLLYKLPNNKKYMKLNITFVLILAGALGNAIDRIMKASVTDFIYFKLIDFPIFNIADIYITVATILLVIFCLFVYKEDDFSFMQIKKVKNQDNVKNNNK